MKLRTMRYATLLLSVVICELAFSTTESTASHWAAKNRPNHISSYNQKYQYNLTSHPTWEIDKLYRGSRHFRREKQSTHRVLSADLRNFRSNPYINIRYSNENKSSGPLRKNEMSQLTTGLYKSYGRGTAVITRPGQVVFISNSERHPKVHKGTVTAKVLSNSPRNGMSKMIHRGREDCFGCPRNRKVIASKQNTFVILPEPCSLRRWVPIAGPRPGMKIQEGIHTVMGRTGYRSGEVCQYQYEVIVRRCGTLSVDYAKVKCTADNAWGSICTVSCYAGYELDGEDTIECQDDLRWSSEPPICRVNRDCPMPQTPDNEKIQCHVPNETDLTSDLIPQNTSCRYKSDGKLLFIVCKEGYWVTKHMKRTKSGKLQRKSKREKI